MNLLQPFADQTMVHQTNILQTDAVSLSNIITSILDLECHLQQFPTHKQLTANILRDLSSRFQYLLQPQSENFNPLPSAACL